MGGNLFCENFLPWNDHCHIWASYTLSPIYLSWYNTCWHNNLNNPHAKPRQYENLSPSKILLRCFSILIDAVKIAWFCVFIFYFAKTGVIAKHLEVVLHNLYWRFFLWKGEIHLFSLISCNFLTGCVVHPVHENQSTNSVAQLLSIRLHYIPPAQQHKSLYLCTTKQEHMH